MVCKLRKRRNILLVLASTLIVFGVGINYSGSPDTDVNTVETTVLVNQGTNGESVESGNLKLVFDEENFDFYVYDSESDSKYWSNPPLREEDQFARGANRMLLNSQIEVEYYSTSNLNISRTTSHAGSVNRDGAKIEMLEDGFRVIYDFENLEFTVPVEFRLGDGYFKCVINSDRIIEGESNKILSINVLPYFGAAGIDQEGYIFVPDGSGALIYLNNGKVRAGPYNQSVYGRDMSVVPAMVRENNMTASLPVAGIKYGDKGIIGVVDKGDALARVRAEVSGMRTTYNSFNFSFRLRASDNFVIGEDNWAARTVELYETGDFKTQKYEVRYYFLNDGNDYVSMAEAYREYLLAEEKLNIQNTDKMSMQVEILGGIYKYKPFLGFPVNTFIPITTYDDLSLIIEEYSDAGVKNIDFVYRNWNSASAKDKIPGRASTAGSLGSRSDLRNLIEFSERNNMSVFPLENFVIINSSIFNRFFRSSAQLSGFPARLMHYKRNIFLPEPEFPEYYLLKPIRINQTVYNFTRNASNFGFSGIAFDGISNMLYSDFSGERYDISFTKNEIVKAAESALKNIENLSVNTPNAYMLEHATYAGNLPLYSSMFDIQDEHVPFYQILLRGYMPYSSQPLNLTGEPQKTFLKTIETGSMPSFVFGYRNIEEIRESPYTDYFSVNWNYWSKDSIEIYNRINEFFDKIGNSTITKHLKVADEVYYTEFSNGYGVIVNYTDKEFNELGFSVEANGYLVVESEDIDIA